VGTSLLIQELERQALRVASANRHVLILGEAGTGRRTLARWLHAHGPRRGRPLAEFHCSGLSETQLDAALFGYAEGAFEGALRSRRGLIELADGGDLLLADVERLPAALQLRLLDFLEAGQLRRHGELRSRRLDVRLLTTAAADLAARARLGRFREALYYRLAPVTLELAPLRKRSEDVPALMAVLPAGRAGADGSRAPGHQVLAGLRRAAWPGNIAGLIVALQDVRDSAVAEPGRGGRRS